MRPANKAETTSIAFVKLACRIAALVLTCASMASVAHAHPAPVCNAELTIDADDGYRLELRYDVVASVMGGSPGHLGDDAVAELEKASADDVEQWIAEARRTFERRLILWFDGVDATPLAVEFPDVATLREGRLSDFGRQPRTVRIFGRAPRGTKQFAVTFPPDCGQVWLAVCRDDGSTLRLAIGEGAKSEPIIWSEPRKVDGVQIGTAIVIIVAAVSFGWYRWRTRRLKTPALA